MARGDARDGDARKGSVGEGGENPLDQNEVEQAYARWAPVYDVVFGAVFAHGRAAAIQAAERVGGRILEVGVGTGISLPDYSRKNRLVGVDICEPMLRKAKERVETQGLSHVEMLALMDGTRLAFADGSFDVVVAQFVITTVPDPEKTLDEFARVVRPGGEIVLVNHFATEAEPLRTLERGFAPLARKLGWRPEFPFRRLTDWSMRAGLPLLERRQTPPLGLFSLLRFTKAA
jgi:phosphatidylethanolamine/phosphatidyl-N-methylethanolamine N-methyltransferase